MLSLNEALTLMRPGDLLAFGSSAGFFSRAIQEITNCPVSHVAVVYRTATGLPTLIESTTLDIDGRKGVVLRHIEKKVSTYQGNVWWLPLRQEARSLFDEAAFLNAADDKMGCQYDSRTVLRVLWRTLPVTRHMPWLKKDGDPTGEFCSGLATRLLIAAGPVKQQTIQPAIFAGRYVTTLLPVLVGEPSDVTPGELCRFGCFDIPQQIHGNRKVIL